MEFVTPCDELTSSLCSNPDKRCTTGLLLCCETLGLQCWLGSRKGTWPVKRLSGGVLVWLSVWSKVQTCIRSSWCHCHSLSLASVKSRLVLPFWYWLTWVDPEKGPLNVCVLWNSWHVCVVSVGVQQKQQCQLLTETFTATLTQCSGRASSSRRGRVGVLPPACPDLTHNSHAELRPVRSHDYVNTAQGRHRDCLGSNGLAWRTSGCPWTC